MQKKQVKKRIIINPETMSYENNELSIETKNEIYTLKDKRAICILADRLTTMKKKIQGED